MVNQRTSEVDKKDAVREAFPGRPHSIDPPKGGQVICGIGEKVATSPITGTGSMTVPLATSFGRSEFGPPLSLSYNSRSDNGPFGFGRSHPLPSTTHKTDMSLPCYRDAEESDGNQFFQTRTRTSNSTNRRRKL